MTRLTLDNDVFFLPEKWDDLTKEQLIRIAALSTLGLSANEFKIYLLVSVLGFTLSKEKRVSVNEETCYKMLYDKKSYLISAPDLAFVCLNSLQFLFIEKKVEGEIRLEIECKLSQTLIKKIKVNNEIWYGPADALNNCIYEEYVRAIICATDYSNTKHISALDKLIATLYRPAKTEAAIDGDNRIAFNDFEIDNQSQKLNKVSPDVKFAILLQLNGALFTLSQTFEYAFKPGSSRVTAKSVYLQQLDLIDTLAKSNIPDKEKIRKTPLYDVLHTFDKLIKDSKNK